MPALQVILDVAYHLDLSNESDITDDSQRFQAAAEWIAHRFSLASLRCSISIVDDETIRQLNRQHLGHDWETDVISFVFESLQQTDGRHVDGELIASLDTARRLSPRAGWNTADELLLYCIHGLLHLAGLDDLDDAAAKPCVTQNKLACRPCLYAAPINTCCDGKMFLTKDLAPIYAASPASSIRTCVVR